MFAANEKPYVTHSSSVSFFGELSSMITNRNGRQIIAYRYPNCHPPEFPWIHKRMQSTNTATQHAYLRALSLAPKRKANNTNGLLQSIELLKGFGTRYGNFGRVSHVRQSISHICRGM